MSHVIRRKFIDGHVVLNWFLRKQAGNNCCSVHKSQIRCLSVVLPMQNEYDNDCGLSTDARNGYCKIYVMFFNSRTHQT